MFGDDGVYMNVAQSIMPYVRNKMCADIIRGKIETYEVEQLKEDLELTDDIDGPVIVYSQFIASGDTLFYDSSGINEANVCFDCDTLVQV